MRRDRREDMEDRTGRDPSRDVVQCDGHVSRRQVGDGDEMLGAGRGHVETGRDVKENRVAVAESRTGHDDPFSRRAGGGIRPRHLRLRVTAGEDESVREC